MNDDFKHLVGFGALKAWVEKHLPLLKEHHPLAPRAIILTGLPGTGKRSVAKAVANSIGKALARPSPEQLLDPGTILLVEDLNRDHLTLIRRLANPNEPLPFVMALTEQPWELPSGLFRADAIEAVWHLDLPDMNERTQIWDLVARRNRVENPKFDPVMLARASHEFTPADIHAAYSRATRASRLAPPDEASLFTALLAIERLIEARREDALRLASWTRRAAMAARG